MNTFRYFWVGLFFVSFGLNSAPRRSLSCSNLVVERHLLIDDNTIDPRSCVEMDVRGRLSLSECDLERFNSEAITEKKVLRVKCESSFYGQTFGAESGRGSDVDSDMGLDSDSDTDEDEDLLVDAISYLKSEGYRDLPYVNSDSELCVELKKLVDEVYSNEYEPLYNEASLSVSALFTYLISVLSLLERVLSLQDFFGEEHAFSMYLTLLINDLEVIRQDVHYKIVSQKALKPVC